MATTYCTSVHVLILLRHLSWPPLDPCSVNALSRLREPKTQSKSTLQKAINRRHIPDEQAPGRPVQI